MFCLEVDQKCDLRIHSIGAFEDYSRQNEPQFALGNQLLKLLLKKSKEGYLRLLKIRLFP